METESPANSISTGDSRWSKTRQIVVRCLRLIIVLQCIGIAGRYLWNDLESESHIFEYLRFERGVSENAAQWLDDAGAYLCLVAGIVFAFNMFLRPTSDNPNRARQQGWRKALYWCEFVAAGFVAVWCFANALAHMARGGIYSELAIGEVAVRFTCPIVLMLVIGSQSKRTNMATIMARWVLTIAISATFIVHGFKAIQLHGPFCDLILLSDTQIFQLDLAQPSVETALLFIGWLDILMAIALIFTRYKIIAIYMLLWGLVTSASRMTAFGWVAWPETVIRTANWGGVCVLATMWHWESVLFNSEAETIDVLDD